MTELVQRAHLGTAGWGRRRELRFLLTPSALGFECPAINLLAIREASQQGPYDVKPFAPSLYGVFLKILIAFIGFPDDQKKPFGNPGKGSVQLKMGLVVMSCKTVRRLLEPTLFGEDASFNVQAPARRLAIELRIR